MNFIDAFKMEKMILMEGSICERLKNEFHFGLDSEISAASLIYSSNGRYSLKRIFEEYIGIAQKYNLPIMITTPTRRANKERISKYNSKKNVIEDNVNVLINLKSRSKNNVFIGGLMGCKGDAYNGKDSLGIRDSYIFHKYSTDKFLKAGVDYLFAGIMPTLEESIGMARAMEETGLPYIISFMLFDNGCLLDGSTLDDAIRIIDESTINKPICYMSNCIHPLKVKSLLEKPFNKTMRVYKRFMGVQVNASNMSPYELNQSKKIMTCESGILSNHIFNLNHYMNLKIIGGCCGTDGSHIEEIAYRMTKLTNQLPY